ncbi:MAG: NUDIX hydrolase [Actinobacteria bacterium]|nr:NUDIX hydrolase [Actinomycetota bacterium]MCL5887096.1 NUDIX hydrolase [Actinomycetota bacterium]
MSNHSHPKAAVTADIALFAGPTTRRTVLLVCRARDPFAGQWALPGGFVDLGEPVESAARRELAEETGLSWEGPLQMVGGYGDPGRDPRGWTVSVVFSAFFGEDAPEVVGGDDASLAQWHPVDALPPLAFDHQTIVSDAISVLRSNGKW